MKRIALLPLFAGLLFARPANAAAVFGGGKPVMVHEDYVLLHRDPATKQVHVLLAARVAPAFPRVQIGYPTPTNPTLEHVAIDLPEVLHKLIAPHEMRAKSHPPAPPAPWIPNGARVDTYVENAGSAEHVFDATWTKSYVDKGFFIGVTGVVTPEDGRVEVLAPTMHISFVSERLVLPRREPPLPLQSAKDGADLPEKPRLPVELAASKITPRQPDISEATLTSMLQDRPAELLQCYERFLERSSDQGFVLEFALTVHPKGTVVAVKDVGKPEGDALQGLAECSKTVLQSKQFGKNAKGYEFQATVTFTPPRIPARRTHIIVVGSSKYVWPNMPKGVRLEEDFEVLPIDLRLALDEKNRRTLGFRDDERVWVSHWVDRTARRTQALDVEFVEEALPAPGGAGALTADGEQAAPPRPRVMDTLPGQTISKKRKRAIAMLSVLVLAMVGALGLGWREVRG